MLGLEESSQATSLVQRIDVLLDELGAVQKELLALAVPPGSLMNTLMGLFAGPAGVTRRLLPNEEAAPHIRVNFGENADVELAIEEKPFRAAQGSGFPNTAELRFTGTSPWLALEADMNWADLGGGRQIQIGICGLPDRTVDCHACVRLRHHDQSYRDLDVIRWTLSPAHRSALFSSPLDFGVLDGINMRREPTLLLFFDTRAPLRLHLDHLIVSFS